MNHNLLLKKLWEMGIRDKRLLMLIKKMLKAGIMNEITVNELGTPQGGIISPILANVYLHDFDQYIADQWEQHPKIRNYKTKISAHASMRQQGHPRYFLIRYADDWVILTHSMEDAQKIKEMAKHFLERNGRLALSEEKTLITNVTKAPLTFLGVETRVRPSRKGKGPVTYSKPTQKAEQGALRKLKKQAWRIHQAQGRAAIIQEILRYNSIVVGIGNYWAMASSVCKCGSKVDHKLWYTLDKIFRKLTGTKPGDYLQRKIPADQTSNLPVRHEGHKALVLYLTYENCLIGLTHLGFSTFEAPSPKIPRETPFSKEGRGIWQERTQKKLRLTRPDDLTMLGPFQEKQHNALSKGKRNFEYYMNRGYTLNRDKCQCKVCSTPLLSGNLHTHHKNPFLPIEQVNRVSNLVSLCTRCDTLVHSTEPNPFAIGGKPHTKLEAYRRERKPVEK